MEKILTLAIETAQSAACTYTKFITPNDTGTTGAHQSGFHIHKNAWRLFFDTPGKRGENKEEFLNILWQNDFNTESRAIYYGVGTRNEYRLTRFGRGFPYLTDDNAGNLLVLCSVSGRYYKAFVLETDEDIDEFLISLNISPVNTNGIVEKDSNPEEALRICFEGFLNSLQTEFPETALLSKQARDCYRSAFGKSDNAVLADPDGEILRWLDAEYQLFKLIEKDRYRQRIQKPFSSVEELIQTANTLLQRRKSRAGFSLEHHLAALFRLFDLSFDTQGMTEGRKKPDFIFPGTAAYHDESFKEEKLIVLAAKTTCKDRWRQVINEADRVRIKYLFTLQEGISSAQLEEMLAANICLVVPKVRIPSFPPEYRERILTLGQFIERINAANA